MCYAIPGKIVEIKGRQAVVDYFGEQRNVLNDFFKLKIGDCVYAQGGIVVNQISKNEAEKILAFWKDKFFELKKIDQKLSQIKKLKASDNLLAILQKVNLNQPLTKPESLRLLEVKKKEELELIFETANNLRQKKNDNACCVHGIIEFSNHCKQDCHYCGIRKSCKTERYRMSLEEIIKSAKHAVYDLGFKALVLQSGEDPWYDQKKLVKLVKEIKKLNILIFLSIGQRSLKTYKKLYQAGARASLLRFETSNPKIYNKIRPNNNLETRLNLIKNLKKQGYIIATGFLINLPGETSVDVLNNILLTKSLKPDMYSFGPLIPTPNTPLANQSKTNKDLVLKTIALTRFVDRQAKILVTTALETLARQAKKQGLLAGANSLMINVTPENFKKKYTIYSSRAKQNKKLETNIKETLDLLHSLGRAPTDIGI